MEDLGQVPLPPYIVTKLVDTDRYQTIYAARPGSAAAPTAGLHFTEELMSHLEDMGMRFADIVLHIGLDTFAPVTEDRAEDHKIHTEWGEIPQETVEAVRNTRKEGGRIVAVGTASARALETAAANTVPGEVISSFAGATDLFILSGYDFKAVDILLTNFHLPHSKLLMLVSAFAGREQILQAYEEAIRLKYHFYSFGDAMLIL